MTGDNKNLTMLEEKGQIEEKEKEIEIPVETEEQKEAPIEETRETKTIEIVDDTQGPNKSRAEKRINKLTKEKYDANRKVESLEEKIGRLEQRLTQRETQENEKKVVQRAEELHKMLQDSIDEGDSKKQADVMIEINKLNSTKQPVNIDSNSNYSPPSQDELADSKNFESYFAQNNSWYGIDKVATEQARAYNHEVNSSAQYSGWSNKQKLDHISEKVNSWNATKNEGQNTNISMGVTNRRPNANQMINRSELDYMRQVYPNKSESEITQRILENKKGSN